MLGPYNSAGDPDLPHIVGFCGRWIALNEILELAAEYFAVGITGDARRSVGGKHYDHRSNKVCRVLCVHPGVVAFIFDMALFGKFLGRRLVGFEGRMVFPLL